MTDRPIIFSGPMVHALLDGHKTMTRRLAWRATEPEPRFPEGTMRATPWQNAKPGDRLWVREACAARLGDDGKLDRNPRYVKYRADAKNGSEASPYDEMDWHTWPGKWSPSIHMPRWASRLTLIVTDTAIEPLKSITSIDASREGVRYADGVPASHQRFYIPIGDGEVLSGWTRKEVFASLWDRLHGPGSWHANPEVVAITFRVVKANIDALEAQAA